MTDHIFMLMRQASQQKEWSKEINKHSKSNIIFTCKIKKGQLCRCYVSGFEKARLLEWLFKQKGLRNHILGCIQNENKSTSHSKETEFSLEKLTEMDEEIKLPSKSPFFPLQSPHLWLFLSKSHCSQHSQNILL